MTRRYVYELAVVVQDGIRRMYENGEDIFYYITMYNEDYAMPAMPEGVGRGHSARDVQAEGRERRGDGAVVRQRTDSERGAAGAGDSGVEVWRACRCVERDQLHGAAAGCAGGRALEPAASGGEGEGAVSAECAGRCEGADYCGERLYEVDAGCRFLRGCRRGWLRWGRMDLDGATIASICGATLRSMRESIVGATLSKLAREGKFKAKAAQKAMEELGLNVDAVDPARA